MNAKKKEAVEIIVTPVKKENESKKFVERYKIHQYWSRKPWYVVREYILKFTKFGDVVLDPFVGGGATAFEALAIKRNIIARDLNPMSILITKVICEIDIDLDYLNSIFDDITEKIADELNYLYKTECRKCHKDIYFVNSIWKYGELTHLFLHCDYCKFQSIVEPTQNDINKIKEIDAMKIENWYPKNIKLPKDSDVDFVHQLYTKRNLIALSKLSDTIKEISEEKYRNMFLLMLTGVSTRTINSIFINRHRFSKNVNPAGVWGEKRFWVPSEHIENNVFYYFKERYKKVYNAKKETNRILENSKSSSNIKTGSAQTLDEIKRDSVDYIFTDPPYAGAIRYLDLSTVWNAWLNCNPLKEKEIIAKSNNNFEEYLNNIKQSLTEMFRVLKDNKYLSICFHFSNFIVWYKILKLLHSFNYPLVNIEIIEPSKRSHNQITMRGTVDTDVIITLKKESLMQKAIPNSNGFKLLSDIINEHLKNINFNKPMKTTEIYDYIISEFAKVIFEENINVKVDISNLIGLERYLENLGAIKVLYEEKDYKGEDRKVLKWKISSG